MNAGAERFLGRRAGDRTFMGVGKMPHSSASNFDIQIFGCGAIMKKLNIKSEGGLDATCSEKTCHR